MKCGKLNICNLEADSLHYRKELVQVLLKVVPSKKVLEAVGYESISSKSLDLSWPVVTLRSS